MGEPACPDPPLGDRLGTVYLDLYLATSGHLTQPCSHYGFEGGCTSHSLRDLEKMKQSNSYGDGHGVRAHGTHHTPGAGVGPAEGISEQPQRNHGVQAKLIPVGVT